MVRRPQHVKQSDMAAIFKAAKMAGVSVKVEIEVDGKIIATTGEGLMMMMVDKARMCGRAATDNEWDEVFDNDDVNNT